MSRFWHLCTAEDFYIYLIRCQKSRKVMLIRGSDLQRKNLSPHKDAIKTK